MILEHVFNRLFLYQAAATTLVYSVLRLVLYLRVRHKRHQLFRYYGIPGPQPSLLDGNFGLYKSEKARYYADETLARRYGKVFCVFFVDEPHLIVTDLEILRRIFFDELSSFRERGEIYLKNPLTVSILFARHNRWKAMRRAMAPSFSAYTVRDQTSVQFIENSIHWMLEYIDCKRSRAQASPSDVEIDVLDLMRSITLSMISGLAIDLPGVQVMEREANVLELDEYVTKTTDGVYLWAVRLPFLRGPLEFMAEHFEFGKTVCRIRRVVNKTIDEGLREMRLTGSLLQAKRPKLMNALIKLHHAGTLSREEVVCNCEAILIAGYDTTSTTLAYIFWVLGKHLEVQDKLRVDVLAHGAESVYLEQVINEVMRLYPTVVNFITRLATRTVRINQLTIPQGTVVQYKTWVMHKNPDYWPEPDKFDPERFRPGVTIHPCAFAPFGLSDRKCLGFQLALLELKMVTINLLLRYRITTKAPAELDLISHALVLTKPKDRIVLSLESLAHEWPIR